mgnify:CR=1 FL=1
MNISFIMSLSNKSNHEIKKIAAENGISLTLDEVSYLRSVIQQASMDWIIFGIPEYVLVEMERKLDSKKVQQILKFLQ